MNGVLTPLAARYGEWLSLPADSTGEPEDDPDSVRAMPLVLRMERGAEPARTDLLAAAAGASVAVCLDPRAQPGGAWHPELSTWIAGRIRKVARRARGSHWRAVQDLPGITVSIGDAEVRALLPSRVADAPKEVRRLQISGSEVAAAEETTPPDDVPLLLLNPRAPMTVGKAAAQVGHATMLLAAFLDETEVARWGERGYSCSVRTATPEQWDDLLPGDDPEWAWRERGVLAARDAGFTEIDPGTITVLAGWPSGSR